MSDDTGIYLGSPYDDEPLSREQIVERLLTLMGSIKYSNHPDILRQACERLIARLRGGPDLMRARQV